MNNSSDMNEICVKLLGTRGTLAVSGAEFAVYGTATSCVALKIGGEAIIIDAGTGILKAAEFFTPLPDRVSVLLTHPHTDHICGLSFFAPAVSGRCPVDIYGKKRAGLTPQQQVGLLLSEPLWPVGTEVFAPSTRFIELEADEFYIGNVKISTLEANHPGGVTLYKLSYNGKSIVIAFDYEHSDEGFDKLATFAENADLLLYDAQFSAEEYETRRGWGHSTPDAGIELSEKCGAKKTVFTHHNLFNNDTVIGKMECEAQMKLCTTSFAKAEEVIFL